MKTAKQSKLFLRRRDSSTGPGADAAVPAKELATAYSLPVNWVEERIEAVRLCLKYQVKLSLTAPVYDRVA